MSSPSRPSSSADRRTTPQTAVHDRPNPLVVGVAAWIVPGAGHALTGQLRKAVAFFVTLLAMFAVGIACGGRLFPLDPGDPLVLLEGAAEWALGLPRIVAALAGAGQGDVVRVTYEYGNTFLIVGGLLNALVILDAVDEASGRKLR